MISIQSRDMVIGVPVFSVCDSNGDCLIVLNSNMSSELQDIHREHEVYCIKNGEAHQLAKEYSKQLSD